MKTSTIGVHKYDNLREFDRQKTEDWKFKRLFEYENFYRLSSVPPNEVMLLARQNPGGKATGPDNIPSEAFRIPAVAREVARLINFVFDDGVRLSELTLAHVVAVPKTPGTSRVEEHRGISLMSCAANIYDKLLLPTVSNLCSILSSVTSKKISSYSGDNVYIVRNIIN